MNSVMLAVVVVLSILFVDMSCGETSRSLTCGQLPKLQITHFDALSASSPYSYDYTLTSLFDCSTKVFTNPARGSNYEGTALSIRGSNLIAYDITLDDDKKAMNATRCDTGEKSIWHAAASQFDDNGAFFCLYSCNGKALGEFVCGSNNNGAFPAELEAVKLAKSVSNGHLIHDANQDCPAHNGCHSF